jgi:hypothetical protein
MVYPALADTERQQGNMKTRKCTGIRSFLLLMTAMFFPGCNIQDSYLYYPSSSAPSEELLKAEQIKPWPSSTIDYRGFVLMHEMKKPSGTVVVFHGNGGTATDRVFYMKALSAFGYRVILAEYPLYGGREGTLGENSFVADAAETVRLAFKQFGEPLFFLGESLGCGVVAAVVGKTPVKVAGIILITPWDTLASVAQSKFPLFPVRLFLTDKYDSISNLKAFKGRIVVVGAERDEVLPIKHADRLYHSLSGVEKRMWVIKGAGHNDWPMYAGASLWKEITDFVRGKDNPI